MWLVLDQLNFRICYPGVTNVFAPLITTYLVDPVEGQSRWIYPLEQTMLADNIPPLLCLQTPCQNCYIQRREREIMNIRYFTSYLVKIKNIYINILGYRPRSTATRCMLPPWGWNRVTPFKVRKDVGMVIIQEEVGMLSRMHYIPNFMKQLWLSLCLAQGHKLVSWQGIEPTLCCWQHQSLGPWPRPLSLETLQISNFFESLLFSVKSNDRRIRTL